MPCVNRRMAPPCPHPRIKFYLKIFTPILGYQPQDPNLSYHPSNYAYIYLGAIRLYGQRVPCPKHITQLTFLAGSSADWFWKLDKPADCFQRLDTHPPSVLE